MLLNHACRATDLAFASFQHICVMQRGSGFKMKIHLADDYSGVILKLDDDERMHLFSFDQITTFHGHRKRLNRYPRQVIETLYAYVESVFNEEDVAEY